MPLGVSFKKFFMSYLTIYIRSEGRVYREGRDLDSGGGPLLNQKRPNKQDI